MDQQAAGPHEADARRSAGLDNLTLSGTGMGSDPAPVDDAAGTVGSPSASGDIEAIHGDLPGFVDAGESSPDGPEGDVEG